MRTGGDRVRNSTTYHVNNVLMITFIHEFARQRRERFARPNSYKVSRYPAQRLAIDLVEAVSRSQWHAFEHANRAYLAWLVKQMTIFDF